MARLTNQELGERYRRHVRWGIVASVLFHAALLFGIRDELGVPPSPFAAAGPRAGDDRAAAGGGGGMRAIQIRVPETAAEQPAPPDPLAVPIPEPVVPPEPEPTIAPPKVEPIAAPEPVLGTTTATGEGAGQGEGKGAVEGPGIEGGTGRGDGGSGAAGRFRVVPPAPRGLILPPSDRPRKVRGKEVAVWVFVTAKGRVVGDSTRLDPGTGDRKFDSRLRKQAGEWVFEPARKDGKPVPEWFRYVLVL